MIQVFCDRCGAPIDDDDIFRVNYGNRIIWEMFPATHNEVKGKESGTNHLCPFCEEYLRWVLALWVEDDPALAELVSVVVESDALLEPAYQRFDENGRYRPIRDIDNEQHP